MRKGKKGCSHPCGLCNSVRVESVREREESRDLSSGESTQEGNRRQRQTDGRFCVHVLLGYEILVQLACNLLDTHWKLMYGAADE